MSLFSRIFGNSGNDTPELRRRDPGDDFWYSSGTMRTMAGVSVTIERARQVPVVRNCLSILSKSVAGLSFAIYEQVAHDERRRADEHPISALLNDPNPETTSYEFFDQMVDDLSTVGFFLAELIYAGQYPVAMWRFDPSDVTVERLADRSLRFIIREAGKPERKLQRDDVWYIPVPPEKSGYAGRSPILHDGREAIAAAIGLHDYSNAFWANDATPNLIFKHPSQFADSESKSNFLTAWRKQLTGRKRGSPGILEFGMDVHTLDGTNEAAQFLETRKELWLDVTRIWNMPPHKVGILDKATFTNIESQGLEFVVDTLSPFLKLIEKSVAKWVIADRRFVMKFNVSSLLRGDTKARFDAYAQGRQWGWLSVNEIRALENRNGIGPTGDSYLQPLNMVDVGTTTDQQQALNTLRETTARNAIDNRPAFQKPSDNVTIEQAETFSADLRIVKNVA